MTHPFAIPPRRQSSSATIYSIHQSMMTDSLCMSMTCTLHILLMQMGRYCTTSMTKQCTKTTSPFMVQVSLTQRDLLCLRTAARLYLFRSGLKHLDPFVLGRPRSRAYMCVCVSMAGRVSILRFILTRVDLFVCMFVCVCVWEGRGREVRRCHQSRQTLYRLLVLMYLLLLFPTSSVYP